MMKYLCLVGLLLSMCGTWISAEELEGKEAIVATPHTEIKPTEAIEAQEEQAKEIKPVELTVDVEEEQLVSEQKQENKAPVGNLDITIAQAKELQESGKYDEAIELLETYIVLNPDATAAIILQKKISTAQSNASTRNTLAEQADMQEAVTTHPEYLGYKAATESKVRRELELVEYLYDQDEYEAALGRINQLERKYPDNLAILTIQERLSAKIARREKSRLEREKRINSMKHLNDVDRRAQFPDDPDKVARVVHVFQEDLDEIERLELLKQLDTPIGRFAFTNATLGDILRRLFTIAGINYVIVDEALTEETLEIDVRGESVLHLLETIQFLVPVHFNYHGGTVFVTNSESPVLRTEIIHLKSGLTNVLATPTIAAMGGGGGEGGNVGAIDPGALLGEGGDEESDLFRFTEALESLVPFWPEGSFTYYEAKSHSLYVKSSPAAIAEIKRLLHGLDYNSVQVLIETRFIEISDNAIKNTGINWTAVGQNAVSDGSYMFGGSSGTAPNPATLLTAEQSVAGSAAVGFAQTLGTGGFSLGFAGIGNGIAPNFTSTLNMLEDRGEANTLSEPKVLTLSNSTGIISISRDIPYIASYENIGISNTNITDTTTTNLTNTSNVPVPRFETVTEQITLTVTPSVARNSDIITMDISPVISEVNIRQVPIVIPNLINSFIENPEVSQRTLSTKLHVRNGQTIVMGGLITEDGSEGQNGVPGLSRIPGLGRLFRQDTSRKTRSKLLIFVTAHIIDPTGGQISKEIETLEDTAAVTLPKPIRDQIAARTAAELEENTARIKANREKEQEAKETKVIKPKKKGPRK